MRGLSIPHVLNMNCCGSDLQKIVVMAMFLMGCAMGASSQSALNDTISLKSVSIYSTRPVAGTLSGYKVHRIDSLALMEKAGVSLSELLTENSPIFVKTYGRGATATVSFRGTSSSHTRVLWNGIRINSPMSGEVDFSLIPLYFADDVNILYGQASMAYGSGGLGGLVSIDSNPDWSKRYGLKLYQSVGDFQTYSTAIHGGYGTNTLRGQTRFFRETSQNNFTYRNTAKIGKPTEVQKNADYTKHGIMQELYFRPRANSMISAKLWFTQTDRGIPKLMSGFSHDEVNRQENQNFNAVVAWQSYRENGNWKLSSGLSLLSLSYQLQKLSAEGNRLPVLDSHSDAWSWYNTLGYDREVLNWLTLGFQADANLHWVESNEEVLSTAIACKQNQLGIRTFIHAKPMERLSLSLLAGEEAYDNRTTPIMASLSAQYLFLPQKNLMAKAGLARNFHYPTLNDLYWQPGGNPNLKPEEGITGEAGISYTAIPFGSRVNIEVSAFSSEINHWIMWLPHLKGYWEPVNIEKVKARGLEGNISLSLSPGRFKLRFLGNYSYTRSTVEDAGGVLRAEAKGRQLPFIPIHSAGVSTNIQLRNYRLAYSFTHFSERFTTTSNNPNSIRPLYPYYMNNISLGYDLRVRSSLLGFQLRVDNLFDESYQTILWRPMPGRNFSLLVRLEI